ncbi:MAG: glycosyltransferase family 2 protein, partial [Bacteroidia bacterium]
MNERSEYDVSVVLPCYQEEGQILRGAAEIYKVMAGSGYTFEMVFVDDGSTDRTKEKILEASRQFPEAKYLFKEKNSGRGRSFSDGAKMAKGKYIGFLDIDLEISCSYLPKIILDLQN